MNIVSRKTIAAVLLSGTAFMGGTAIAQDQSAGGAGTSQNGAKIILPQDGASGQVDTRSGAKTAQGIEVDADDPRPKGSKTVLQPKVRRRQRAAAGMSRPPDRLVPP